MGELNVYLLNIEMLSPQGVTYKSRSKKTDVVWAYLVFCMQLWVLIVWVLVCLLFPLQLEVSRNVH